jgi:galactokinase
MLDIGPIHRTEYELGEDRSVRRPAEPVCIAEAPGRIHYLGEHGEEGAGLYVSSAIDRAVRVAVSLRKDNSLRFFAADLGERKRTTLVNLKYKREDRWANYIKLAIYIFAELGYPVRGLNFTVMGTIPQQIGLASSQAIETAAVMALKGFFRYSTTEKALAKRLVAARTAFFGIPSSPVDYLVALSAKKDHFLVVDEASEKVKLIKSPFSKYKFLLMDSRVPRMGVDEELKQRRADTQKGLELLSKKKPGLGFRDFASGDLLDSMGALPEEIRRRCLHVVEELQRIHETEEALRQADYGELSRLICHSHESLRDLYEVSCPEIDWLVKRAQEIEGVLGSRMTGAGFGGCTYTILKTAAVDEYRRKMEDYERIFGFRPQLYEIRPASGARVIQRA